ncbi:hypothetical protein V491_04921 [Pseudogymnoascus sp. VKM F-3775]|nr:hypothetical protein V491_04921 [Pseudogymnoascus sp. VKM F-3775]
MSNNTSVMCYASDNTLFQAGCQFGGTPGSRAADSLKSCCPVKFLSFSSNDQIQGSNCAVTCGKMTAEEAESANPCLERYFLEHPLPESGEEQEFWTCPSPEPSAAVRGGTRDIGANSYDVATNAVTAYSSVEEGVCGQRRKPEADVTCNIVGHDGQEAYYMLRMSLEPEPDNSGECCLVLGPGCLTRHFIKKHVRRI